MIQNVADIDECAENTDGCAQLCTNTVGSFTCGCRTGYDLSSDGRTCQGKKLKHNNNIMVLMKSVVHILCRY